MAKSASTKGLQIDEDIRFQQQSWTIERFGWTLLLLLLLTALLGFTGSGPFSDVTVQDDHIEVEYKKFSRKLAPTELSIQIDKGKSAFWIEQSFWDRYQLERITPEPDEVIIDGERIIYKYKQNKEPLEVTMHLQPQQHGFFKGNVGLDNKEVTMNQFIYP